MAACSTAYVPCPPTPTTATAIFPFGDPPGRAIEARGSPRAPAASADVRMKVLRSDSCLTGMGNLRRGLATRRWIVAPDGGPGLAGRGP